MANSYLTVTDITRRALAIAHQKATFIGSIDRQFDGSFEATPKKGGSIRIRLPNQYTVTTGATLVTQDQAEDSVTLAVGTQKHVGMHFTSQDLTVSIDDFSSRFIEPAMAVLMASVEADALQNMTLDVYNMIDNDGNAITFKNVLQGRQKLVDNLAPPDMNRHALLSSTHNTDLVDALKGLFNDQRQLSEQYREGEMGRTAGLMFAESTHVSDHATGTAVKGDTLYNINGANQTGSTITVNTGTTTLLAGDIITIAGCNRVHPETKVSTGVAQQFVVTADSGATATTLSISPAIVVSGAKQNVSASPTNGGAITKVGAGNAENLNGSLVYHRDAFTFATANLVMPEGVDFARREVYDGLSLRIVRDYNINNDEMPCRIDIFYGYLTQRAEWAARLHADG